SECLTRVAESRPAVAHRFSRELYKRWYRDLMDSDIMPVEHGCAVATAIAPVAGLCGQEGAPPLLNCALAGARPEIGSCCADALVEAYPAASNPDVRPELLDADVRQGLFENLAAVIDRPDDALLSEGNEALPVQWSGALLLHWSARLGCSLVAEDRRPERIASMLASVTHSHCGIELQNTAFSFETTNLIRRTRE